jgi:predicted metal-dependent hydrolase
MNNSKRVTLTRNQRGKLISEKERTKVGVLKLLRGTRKERPEGITVSMIEGWISGEVSTASPEHLNWVLERYRTYQPKPRKPSKPERVTLTKDHIFLLNAEKARTGLGTIKILRHIPKPQPEGLTKNIIQSWMLGTAKSAKKSHWESVLNAYAAISVKR